MVHHRTNVSSKTTTAPIVGSWTCNVCGDEFVNPKAHVDHMGTHSLEYPSSCPLCLARFRNSNDLNNHDCVASNKKRSGHNSNKSNSAINEKQKQLKQKHPLQSEVVSVSAEDSESLILNSYNLINRSEANSVLSPSPFDDTDVEDAFEAAENQIFRSRSSSTETNNNLSDSNKSDFIVADPWEATSTIFNSYIPDVQQELDARPPILEPMSTKQPVETDSFIDEIHYPVKTRRRKITKSHQPLSENPLNKRHANDGHPSTSVSNKLISCDSALVGSDIATKHGEMSLKLTITAAVGESHSPLQFRAPSSDIVSEPQDLKHSLSGSDHHDLEGSSCESLITEDNFENTSPNSVIYSLQDKQCRRCKLRFEDVRKWDDHLKRHILEDPHPFVWLDPLNIEKIGAEGPFKVTEVNGKVAISAKPHPIYYSTDSVQSTSPPTVTEHRKEALKLTICRTKDRDNSQYVVKRNSTEGDSEQGREEKSRDTSQPSPIASPPVPSLSLPTSPPEEILPDIDYEDETEVVIPEKSPKAPFPLPSSGSQPKPSTFGTGVAGESRTVSKVQFKARFYKAAQSVRRDLQQKKLQELPAGMQKNKKKPSDAGQPIVSEKMTSSNNPEQTPVTSQSTEQQQRQPEQPQRQEEKRSESGEKVQSNPSDTNSATSTNKVPITTVSESSQSASASPRLAGESSDSASIAIIPSQQHDASRSLTEPAREDPVESEPLQRSGVVESSSPRESDSGAVDTSEKEMVHDDHNEEDDEDDEDALVIHDADNSAANATSNDKTNNSNKESLPQDKMSEAEVDNAEKESINEDNPKASDKSDEEDDFRCRVCQKLFSDEQELNSHFSNEHFRTVGVESIQEPESPFPVVQVPGRSSIFESDEVEESEPYGVESERDNTTLSSLLRRRSTDDERLMINNPAFSNYLQIQNQIRNNPPYGLHHRPSLPVRAILPNHRQPMTIPPEFRARLGGVPAGRIAPAPQQSQRVPIPYRNYPTTLHQALVSQQPPTSQSASPPRPPLRPLGLGSANMRGSPPQPPQLQSRPPLMRVPPPSQGHQNPQSILRQSPPLGQVQAHGQPQQQVETAIMQTKQRMQEIQSNLTLFAQQIAHSKDPAALARVNQERDNFLLLFHNLTGQLARLEEKRSHFQQEQSHQQLQQQQLQRQQINNLHLQQQHLRQQQLQQQQQQQRTLQQLSMGDPAGINANGKRPSVEIFESASRLKQPRLDPEERSMKENLSSVKLPHGVTLCVVPQGSGDSSSSGHTSTTQTVAPGSHSAGSHSSGTISPAAPSPTMVANRLAQSGITLTPASAHSPLVPLSPPANPVLSPISENSSPRDSPRINNSVIQRAPSNPSPISAASSNSPNSATHQEGFAIPRAPPGAVVRSGSTSSTGSGVTTNPNAERPDRPPTIDLTDDNIQLHNAQMRATGGGVVSLEQIQNHEANIQRRNAGIPGTSQIPRLPAPSRFPCSLCPVICSSVEAMNEHRIKFHGQIHNLLNSPPNSAQFFRQPQPQNQVAIKRPSPPIGMPGQQPSIRGPVPRGPPPPPQLMQMRGPAVANPPTRPQEIVQRSRPSGEGEKFVIPLLNLAQLNPSKLRDLYDMGVASFIPLQGLERLGIPIMRLQPDVPIGHFPHDTAIEIGPIERLAEAGGAIGGRAPPRLSSGPPPQSAKPPNRGPQIQPPSVVSPPMGTICTDRNCPDLMRRPSPGSGIPHPMGMSTQNHSGAYNAHNHHLHQHVGGNANTIPHNNQFHHQLVTQVNRN